MILFEKYVFLSFLCSFEINIIGEGKNQPSKTEKDKKIKAQNSHVEKAPIIFRTKHARAFQSNWESRKVRESERRESTHKSFHIKKFLPFSGPFVFSRQSSVFKNGRILTSCDKN